MRLVAKLLGDVELELRKAFSKISYETCLVSWFIRNFKLLPCMLKDLLKSVKSFE